MNFYRNRKFYLSYTSRKYYSIATNVGDIWNKIDYELLMNIYIIYFMPYAHPSTGVPSFNATNYEEYRIISKSPIQLCRESFALKSYVC